MLNQQQLKYRLSAYIFLGVCLVVAGCNTTYSRKPGGADTSAKLSGSQAKVEAEEQASFDPFAAHMRARSLVDPSDIRSEHAYTKKKLSKAVLGPDIAQVLKVKPTAEERAAAAEIARIEEEQTNNWFAGLFDEDEKKAREGDIEAFKTASAADVVKDQEKEEPKPAPKKAEKAEKKKNVKETAKVASKSKNAVKSAAQIADAAETAKTPTIIGTAQAAETPKATKEVKVAKKAPKKTLSKQAPAAQSANKMATNLRVGEHPNKTRMVIDLSDKPQFTYQVQEDKNLLIVSLKDTKWDTKARKVYAQHPLLLAYIAKDAPDGGTILAFKLRKKIKVLSEIVMPPNKTAGHRIVFDIAAG